MPTKRRAGVLLDLIGVAKLALLLFALVPPTHRPVFSMVFLSA